MVRAKWFWPPLVKARVAAVHGAVYGRGEMSLWEQTTEQSATRQASDVLIYLSHPLWEAPVWMGYSERPP